MNMNESKEEGQGQDRFSGWLGRSRLWFGSLVLVAGFVISILIGVSVSPPVGIGIMGIGILLTMLIGGNILSKERDLSGAEVRRSIAVSCVSVFFGLLAFGGAIKTEQSVLQPILENFWWIIITIIGFYFGGRSAEKIVESVTTKWAKGLESEVTKIGKELDEVRKANSS
jgi:hypothetical protein